MSSVRGSASAEERRYLSRVAALGCIVCQVLGIQDSPAEIHHIRSGAGIGQRSSNLRVLPLCAPHHRIGGYGVAYHAGRKAWEKAFGTELELLARVYGLLGVERSEPDERLDEPYVFTA